jgi:vanillate/3-O-methylgallate O-demethylase
MTQRSLADLIAAHPNVVSMLHNAPGGIYVFPVVAPEFNNWRSEQKAWRESAVLFDQTHHLDNLTINDFANFDISRAKQLVAVTSRGYVIGDVIAFREDESKFVIVGRAPTANWLEYNASLGVYDVTISHDPRSPSRPDGKAVNRTHFRFQVQGPDAWQILEKVHGGPIPELKLFRVGPINIGRKTVHALRHGMAGAPGLEFWGPYEDRDEVRATLLQAAGDLGLDLVQSGTRAYSMSAVESGWIPCPLPAIYTGPELDEYRRWLPATSYEAFGSLAGSFVSDNIEDYYVTPYELGYSSFIKTNSDFVGAAALEAMKGQPHRKRVTLEWHPDDVLEVVGSSFRPGETACKWIDFPQPNYGATMADRVMDGETQVGMSMYNGYSYNERTLLSLGVVAADAEIGDELTLVWGEPNGGSLKPSVERPHRQAEVRVRVAPTPYSQEARENYAESWRTQQI